MAFLDGKLGKQTFLERITDPFMNSRRSVLVAATIFTISILASPMIAYFGFAYFTAKVGPWWLDPMMSVWSLSLFLSGAALLLLALARFLGNRVIDSRDAHDNCHLTFLTPNTTAAAQIVASSFL